MKEIEAPDKIYVHWSKHAKRLCASAAQGKGDIEYTRTNAFIEKAERYIRSVADGLDRDDDVEAFINEFINYMKGE